MTNEDAFYCHFAIQLDNVLVIFGGTGRDEDKDDDSPSTHVIWMYNLYTEEWGKHVIPKHVIPKHVIDKNGVPWKYNGAVAVAINGTIYTFGGSYGKYANLIRERNTIWTLSKAKTGFTWSFIKSQHNKASPSPRKWHSGWEYAGKLWVFGGHGPSPERYLNDHGDILSRRYDLTMNNQLLCYNPNIQKWTNPQCFGAVPTPRHGHESTSIKDKVWIFGGRDENWTLHDDMFELTMDSLTWTQIETAQPRPQARKWFTLTALTNNHLVLHGGDNGGYNSDSTLSDTWIMDLSSYSWRQYESRKDHTRRSHTASVCPNNNVIIIGGSQGGRNGFNGGPEYLSEPYDSVFHVMLEAKSLQQLAARTIYRYENEINWNCLPEKLISLLGLSGPPEPVRHVLVKRISKNTKYEDVFTMIEQNGFTIKELKCVSHPKAQFKSYKLAVPLSEFNKLFNENLWPNGVLVRTYWPQKPGSK